jgi:hypothetical protein
MKKFGYFFVLTLVLCMESEARTIKVGKSGHYTSIQKALDAAVRETVFGWKRRSIMRGIF